MLKVEEFCKILANVLNHEVLVPYIKDSAFIGNAINTLFGLKLYPDYKSIISELLEYETFNVNPSVSNKYKSIFNHWKNIKNKIDDI